MNKFQTIVAYKTLNLVTERHIILYSGRKAYWVWWIDDHAVIIFDASMVDIRKLDEDFAHALSTRLKGRMVLRTNSRGLFFQVDPEIPSAPVELIEKPMNLAEQPSPFHLPVGNTDRGDLWISLLEGTSFLVGGMSRMHKSGLLHAWIQALLHGSKSLIYAWDGKQNAEYGRYVGRKNFTPISMHGLQAALKDLKQEAITRMQKFALTGYPDIISYNAAVPEADFIEPIALFIDEVAEVEDQEILRNLVSLYRAAGIFPVFATNNPMKASVIAKTNLTTRISFPVIAHTDSQVVLGRSGANKLPKIPGRGLMEYKGRMVEFQSFTVDYPEPTEAGIEWVKQQLGKQTTALSTVASDQLSVSSEQPTAEEDPNAEQIKQLHAQGMSLTNIVYQIWGKSGSSFAERMAKVREILATATTATASNDPGFDPNLPINGTVAR